MQLRIGERDGSTGLYAVIWPDGSTTLNGIKIFNAEHRAGDLVLATQRSDGMLILSGVVAADLPDRRTNSAKLTESKSYLTGQVFNDDEILDVTISLIPLTTGPIEAGQTVPFARVQRTNSRLMGDITVNLALDIQVDLATPVLNVLCDSDPYSNGIGLGFRYTGYTVIPANRLFTDVSVYAYVILPGTNAIGTIEYPGLLPFAMSITNDQTNGLDGSPERYRIGASKTAPVLVYTETGDVEFF